MDGKRNNMQVKQTSAQLARNLKLKEVAQKRRALKAAGISTAGMNWEEISQKHTALTRGDITPVVQVPKVKGEKFDLATFNKLKKEAQELTGEKLGKRVNAKRVQEILDEQRPEYVIKTTSRANKKTGAKFIQVDISKKQTKKNLQNTLKKIGQMEEYKNMTIQLPVKTMDGDKKYSKVFTLEEIVNQIDDDLVVTQPEQFGSDMDDLREVQVDLGQRFRIGDFSIQPVRANVRGACNTKVACDREFVTDKREFTVKCHQPYSAKGRCFYMALKHLGLSTDVCVKDQKPVSLSDADVILGRNNLNVEIISLNVTNGQLEVLRPRVSDDNCKQLLLHEKLGELHYYPVTSIQGDGKAVKIQKKKKNAKKVSDSRKSIYCFYDLETVFDSQSDDMARQYSYVLYCCTKEQFESEGGEITPSNLQSFKDRCQAKCAMNSVGEMVDYVTTNYPGDKYSPVFISFNGANFDDYFVLNHCIDQDIHFEATYSNKSLLGLTTSFFKCWDLKKFLTLGSLLSNCQSFNVYPCKKDDKNMGFTHEDVQSAYDAGSESWSTFMSKFQDTIMDYNRIDVLSLYSLVRKFRSVIQTLTGDDVLDYNTIGQHAYSLCERHWKNMGYDMKAPTTEEMDRFIRKCLTAGRTEVFAANGRETVKIVGKLMSMVDVVSLYPTAYLSALNMFPCGELSWVESRDSSKLGFYQVRVNQPANKMNVLPRRNFEDATQPLDWKYKGEYETYCTSVDIDVMLRNGIQCEVVMGLEFSKTISGADLFGHMKAFKDMKVEQDIRKENKLPGYAPALREVCKLYLNAVSGKVIQRNFDEMTKICYERSQVDKVVLKCVDGTVKLQDFNSRFVVVSGKKMNTYDQQHAKPSYLGVYIYAHARQLMYEEVYNHVTCLYGDTDSVLTYSECVAHLKSVNPKMFAKGSTQVDGKTYKYKEFGSLDVEVVDANVYYGLAPKNYLVQTQNEDGSVVDHKVKGKGISFKTATCCYINTHFDGSKSFGEQIAAGAITPLKKDVRRLFDAVHERGHCEVVCEQFRVKSVRNTNNTTYGIQRVRMIKSICSDEYRILGDMFRVFK